MLSLRFDVGDKSSIVRKRENVNSLIVIKLYIYLTLEMKKCRCVWGGGGGVFKE